jgi:hypothetical protein
MVAAGVLSLMLRITNGLHADLLRMFQYFYSSCAAVRCKSTPSAQQQQHLPDS